MISQCTPTDSRRRRRIHYIDKKVQKWLVVALVFLEILLATVAIGVLYWHLEGIVEDNLYRVHFIESPPLFDQLLLGAQKVLGTYILINVFALCLADAIWRHYVNSVVREFRLMIAKTEALDFSPDPPVSSRHELLAHAREWRARERRRFAAIRERVDRLDVMVRGDPHRRERLLLELDELL